MSAPSVPIQEAKPRFCTARIPLTFQLTIRIRAVYRKWLLWKRAALAGLIASRRRGILLIKERVMKKLLVLTIFIAGLFLLPSCSYDEDHRYVIRNDSSGRTVTFTFNAETIELGPEESATRFVNSWAGWMSPQIVTVTCQLGTPLDHRHIRTSRSRSATAFTFTDAPFLSLYVTNNLPELSVRLWAVGGYIFNGPLTTMTIGYSPSVNTETAYIFTDEPRFVIQRRNPYYPGPYPEPWRYRYPHHYRQEWLPLNFLPRTNVPVHHRFYFISNQGIRDTIYLIVYADSSPVFPPVSP